MAVTTDKDFSKLCELDYDALLELQAQEVLTGGEVKDIMGAKLAQYAKAANDAREEAEAAKKEAAAAKAAGNGGVAKKVKEVVSTKPGWVTMRYTGRGFPTSGSVATWEALLEHLDKNADKVRSIVASVRAAGPDEKAHRKLACYSAAKEARD